MACDSRILETFFRVPVMKKETRLEGWMDGAKQFEKEIQIEQHTLFRENI